MQVVIPSVSFFMNDHIIITLTSLKTHVRIFCLLFSSRSYFFSILKQRSTQRLRGTHPGQTFYAPGACADDFEHLDPRWILVDPGGSW